MRSLKTQIVSLFLLISITLIGMIYVAMRLEMTRNVLPINTSMTQQMVDDRANQIDGWFGERLSELRLLANLPAQRTYTRAQFFKETDAVTNFDLDNYVSLRLVSTDGVSHSATYPDFSVKNRDYYREMQRTPAKAYTVSNLLTSKEDRQSIVIILYRLAKPLADHTAYIAAAVPLTKVEALAHNLSIYDGSGELLGGEAKAPRIDPQREVLLSTRLAQLPGWKINYIVQKADLRESTQQMMRLLLVIALVVSGLLGGLLLILWRRIVHPLVGLTTTMTRIQAGGHDIRATVEGPQEIQTLATTFNTMLARVYENEAKYREASIRVLQGQIQPHFLYNTLDTIQWQILGGEADAAVDMLENLSTFFRKGLNHGQELISLRDELAHVNSYVKIQTVRFPQLAHFDVRVAADLLDQPVMHFILQPLVENAINHGIRPLKQPVGRLTIRAERGTDATLVITVANNGVPIAPAVLTALNDGSYREGRDGYGIYNVCHRLQLFYNGHAKLRFRSQPDLTSVQVTVPIIKGELDNETITDR
ncbi:cache domain-containing sensor histidine kinase [Lactiplantibacillus plajomi]|uniref:Sensor histidine kinase n=1 Tax=Lactiplantibacillus plajomi TaxID=1457217 RepID=A0ABV6K3M8_9LACO|nr:sensor histidine kinase [Lactiplantibacillus plajomi]